MRPGKHFYLWRFLLFWKGIILSLNISAQQSDHRILVEQSLFNQEYRQAIRLTDSILKADSTASWAWILKGRAEMGLLRYQDALNAFRKAGVAYPDSIPVLTGLGMASNALGDYASAITWYGKILQLDSTRTASRIALARALARHGRLQDAITQYNLLIKEDSHNFAYHKELGLVYLKADSTDQGIWHLHDAINLNNRDLALAFQLSNLYITEHELKLAVDIANLGLQADSSYAPLYRTVGYVAYLYKEYSFALAMFDNCMVYGDTSLFVRKYNGYSLFNLGKYDKALPWIESVYKADTTLPEPAYYLGLTWENLKAYEKANSYLQTALRLYEPPKELAASIYREIGRNYYELKDWVNAYEFYRNSYALDQKDPALLYSMGVLCEEHLNDKPVALRYYNKILESSDMDREALEGWTEKKAIPLAVLAYRRIKHLREEMHFEGKIKE